MFKQIIIELLTEKTNLHQDEVERLLETPPNLELGDYSFPCFSFADPKNDDPMWEDVEKDFFIKKNPADIAKHFHDILTKNPLPKQIEKIETKGPYLNFFINKKELAEAITKINENFGKLKNNKKQKIMTEFCHLNTHKDMHIGHTRNIALGESISRLLEFSGNKVIRTNYQGDIGMHVAKSLWGLQNLKKLKLKEPKDNKGKWLGLVYSAAGKASEENEETMEEINEINKKLYKRDKKLTSLWKKTRQWSINYFEKTVYPDFDVKFDRFYFESEVQEKGLKIANKLLKDNIAKMSKGAMIIDFEKDNLGIFIILKSDKTSLYSTRDLYLAVLQNKEYHPDKIIHIVGSEHDLYFKQLFKTIEYYDKKIAEKESHLSYALVNSPTGKLKSRDDHGKKILYDDTIKKLINLAIKGMKDRKVKLSEKELNKRARTIALGAVKYQMLSQSPNRVIIFDEKQIMSFEGNTGPYLQYSYARASSIIKKAKQVKHKVKIPNLTKSEIALMSEMIKFPHIIKKAEQQLNPALIANYSYDLAKLFNEFYHSNKVIGSEEELFRLRLIESFRHTIKNSLSLLGIDVLEEM
ncbi:arginine--tRNA ligase [Candidatus Pacearchaeota archaeon]|jgi:arginyl-tRNA synthetase|nr:arginine--tRNA ligase [Candidatus Pacearchaeota archaeon]|tara:strand:- start:9190 stop:10932 length:1743 start_codon:yes stop_codon:yes gene_type:complete